MPRAAPVAVPVAPIRTVERAAAEPAVKRLARWRAAPVARMPMVEHLAAPVGSPTRIERTAVRAVRTTSLDPRPAPGVASTGVGRTVARAAPARALVPAHRRAGAGPAETRLVRRRLGHAGTNRRVGRTDRRVPELPLLVAEPAVDRRVPELPPLEAEPAVDKLAPGLPRLGIGLPPLGPGLPRLGVALAGGQGGAPRSHHPERIERLDPLPRPEPTTTTVLQAAGERAFASTRR
jgi:hypothetical protein